MCIDEKDRIIEELRAENAAQAKRITELENLVADLTERLSKNSRNSSKPPSSDPPWQDKPKSKRGKKRKRKRGAKFGHPKHERLLVPAEKVTETVDVKPTQCKHCGAGLIGEDADPRIHQVVDLPPIVAQVTEYRLHTLACACGAYTLARLPDGVPQSSFGSAFKALVAFMTGKCRLSKQSVVEFFSDVLGIRLSMGMVAKIEKQVGAALVAPYEEAHEHVQHQEIVHADETGWREAGKKAWLWTVVAVTSMVAVFRVAAHRSAQVAKQLLGEDYPGIVVSDRFTSYLWLKCRQLCWSHLLRDFQAMVDRGGGGKRIGHDLLRAGKRTFKLWYRVRDGTLNREQFEHKMLPIIDRVHRILVRGSHCSQAKTAAVCREMLKLEESLWAFVFVEGVEPTNNLAERTLRFAVIWRKMSYGTQNATGSRFVERMLTVVMTLKMQKRDVLTFLKDAIEAYADHSRAPSLLSQEGPAQLRTAA